MRILYFGTYARMLKNCAQDETNESLINALMNCITIPGGLKINEDDDTYYFSPPKCTEILKGSRKIQQKIVNAISDPMVQEDASNYFRDHVTPMLDDLLLDSMISDLKNNYDLGNVDKSLEKEEFLTKTMFYSLKNHNEKSDRVTRLNRLEEDVRIINEKLQRFGRPEQISVPEDLQPDEMIYIAELLKAYASGAGKQDFTLSSLDETINKKYSDNFKFQRKYFYSAESVRRSSRDMLMDQNNSYFEDLKEEMSEILVEVVEDDYLNGFKKLNTVMKNAANANVQSCVLSHIHNWITANVKRGVCHFLVTDGVIKWVD